MLLYFQLMTMFLIICAWVTLLVWVVMDEIKERRG